MKLKKNLWRGLASIGAFVGIAAGWTSAMAFENDGNINHFLGITFVGSQETTNYKSSYGELNDENCLKLEKDGNAFAIKEVEESVVLLKNDNNALPLKTNERNVTLFGYGSNNLTYRGTNGGPKLDQKRFTSIHDAFTNKGFNVNETVFKQYASTMNEEPDNSIFTSQVKSSFESYSDVAVVIISRHGGEGFDQKKVNSNGVSDMALQPNEKAMLQTIKDSGKFTKTVVLLNSVYQLEVSELSSYGVDSIIWMGNPGYQGSEGVVNVLTGEANPSGRLVDTYATSALSSPAITNMGEFAYSNGAGQSDEASYYMVYAENIYIGYRYYETRYEDCVLKRGSASSAVGTFASTSTWNYGEEVSYPFGYGLSYTSFTEEVVENSFKLDSEKDVFTVDVKVTNTGDVKGRRTVQVYAQVPYTSQNILDKVEKSAIQLVGFEKTKALDKNESETVTVSIPRYSLASFNEKLTRDNGKTGGYVLDEGNYYFAVGNDVHDALNNILARKFETETIMDHTSLSDIDGNVVSGDKNKVNVYTLASKDTESYRYAENGVEVNNEFVGDDYSSDINKYVENTVTYLTRNDWNTFPTTSTVVTLNDKLKNALKMDKHVVDSSKPLSSVTYGVDAGLTLADMAGVEFNDPKWTTFIQQFGIEDLAVCPSDQYSNEAVALVRKPKNSNAEGPEGINGVYLYGNKVAALCGASLTNLAATFDREMAKKFGDFMAEDALYCGGKTLVMAPGSDLHRTPFGGRAAEYFSECPLITAEMNTPLMEGLSAKGLIGCIKHVAVNDQEIHRLGVACFLTEQTLRENNLKCFEKSVRSGHVKGIMTSYNRIGACYSGNNPVLQNTVFREEWGFKGFTICDATQHSAYSPTADCMINGADMFCISRRTSQIITDVSTKNDGELLLALQEANHRIFYAYANSSIMNGLTANTEIKQETEWWKILVYGLNAGIDTIALACAGLYVFSLVRKEQ